MLEWTTRRQEELRAEYLAAPEGDTPNTLSPEEEEAISEIEAEIRRHLSINFGIRGRAADALLYQDHGGHGYIDIMIDEFLTEGKDLNNIVVLATTR